MVFRAFLEQSCSRPRRRRAHLASLLLHLAAVLGFALVARVLRRDEPLPRMQLLSLPVTFVVPRPGAGLEARAAAPVTGRKRAPRLRRPVVARDRAPTPTAVALPSSSPDSESGFGDSAQMPGDLGAGGLGDEASDGDGGGIGRGRRPTLFARVIGGGIPIGVAARGDRRFVSLKEATPLRTHDYFPRLPAALWTERGPYVVVVELCVSPEGRVSEAALLSQASARLDPVVLAAVRGWRYRPRFEDGKPSPFCHGVVIKYERAY